MREFTEVLNERSAELSKHLDFLRELEAHAAGRSGLGRARTVDVEHVNILKSGYLVHLYNVVESVMSKIIEDVGISAKAHSPIAWSDKLLREWARGRAGFEKDVGYDNRLDRICKMLAQTAGHEPLDSVRVLTRPGNWSDVEVVNIAGLLGCDLVIPEPVRVAACEDKFEDNFTCIKYVRHKRNRLAHGNESFQTSAAHLTPDRLQKLSDPVVAYLRVVASSYERYLDERKFLREAAV